MLVLLAVVLAVFLLPSPWGLVAVSAAIAIDLAEIGFGLSESLALSLACLFVMGAADMVSVVIRHTLVQAETPDALRGRVAACAA